MYRYSILFIEKNLTLYWQTETFIYLLNAKFTKQRGKTKRNRKHAPLWSLLIKATNSDMFSNLYYGTRMCVLVLVMVIVIVAI